ncbi:IS3 family transposase [Pseudovibrio sp. Tun.PSC04-5.I4]|uniref:IS3 family transposase n=1 Tax=Pseudovibrio sp. Tun.PSC04-5.I4 TaxID=1798213 RepID=UPI001AD919E9|nr:IS3 family transposase [Pseudovibrio sp. Tun.PSC04-5.I4]
MLPPGNIAIRQLSREEGICEATLHKWRAEARGKGQLLPCADTSPEGWSSRDKFAAVLETAALNEADLGEYCRKRGLYPAQIAAWRVACEQANDWDRASTARLGQATKEEKKKVKDLERELARKEKALAEAAALLILRKKVFSDLGGRRGRMISTPDRTTAVALINEAVTAGARRLMAFAELEISERTFRRWTKDGQIQPDQRPIVPRLEPANKLSEYERAAVLEVCNSEEFASLPPSQIVPKLADQGRYLASESSFYRILRTDGQQHHRGRAKPPVRRKPPTSYQARGPCQVWTWDITWMPGPIAGMFFYLYLIVDIFSRKIVGWEVHERESAERAAELIEKAVLAQGCVLKPLVLHADNGSPMKGATMKTTMERLGITASYSRPRVSNDNPFSEALFRTCKYRPDWPSRGFATKADAQAWVKSFVIWYNSEHLHSAIRFVTPDARHAGQDRATLDKRARIYANARAQKPERWSGKTRNWLPEGPVWLNPEREISGTEIRDAA